MIYFWASIYKKLIAEPMTIGILLEPPGENRVAMLPETAAGLVKMKVNVLVERGAGARSFASDNNYEIAGAKLVSGKDLLKGSDIILAINSPEKEVIAELKEGQILIAAINPYLNKELVRELAAKNVTSFSLELLPRTTRAQSMDVLSSQATVAGYKAILDAANTLPEFMQMFMSAAGTIRPAKVLVLGAGVAGLQAIATAKRLGAVVEAFDVRSAAGEEVRSLGAKFIEVEGAKDDSSAGGYAVEQAEDFKMKQQQLIHDHAVKSNIIICAAQIPGKKAPILLQRETVEQMKQGSIIVDLSSSTGGNCELTLDGETIVHQGVRIIGRSNYPSDLPVDASKMFGNNIFSFIQLIVDNEGKINLNFQDDLVKGTCLTHNREIVNKMVRDAINN
jgi:NAD(P) transhydrogenase subunit alpha